RAPCYAAEVSTLAERLAWLLAHRGFRSRRGPAPAAGPGPPPIPLFLKGEGGRGPPAAPATASARQGGFCWVGARGRGPGGAPRAEPCDEPFVDPYPRRDQALDLLTGSIDPPVRAALLKESPPTDLSLEAWLARAQELQRLLKEFRKGIGKS